MNRKRFLRILVISMGVNAYAGISVVSGPTIVDDDSVTGQMVFSSVSVEAGDRVVVAAAPNKTAAANLLSMQWSGVEGSDGNLSTVQSADFGGRACYLFSVEVLQQGDYQFTVVPALTNLTAHASLFVLRADAGSIAVADTQVLEANSAAPGLAYAFGSEVSGGIAIEAFASKDGKEITLDSAYSPAETGSGRFSIYSTLVNGTGWSRTHDCIQGAQDFVGAGAVFVEEFVDPQPPEFRINPVKAPDAVTNELYEASLAGFASDPNGDALLFWNDGGPAWLQVSTNGDLSGIPLISDAGTNQWPVFVTDGISGTNAATLEIVVMTGPPAPQTERTNIVFIVIDDLGWMDLGIQGSTFYETPRIDELARNGMRFTQGYAAHPRCLPSRYGLMSGRFPGANGVPGGWPENNLRPSEVTVAEALKAGGYATCFAGKWHLIGTHGADNLPQNQGFDINFSGGKAGAPLTYFYPYRKEGTPAPTNELTTALYFEEEGVEGEYVTDRLTDEALDWMADHADQPMFLCMWHYGVHTPYEAPADLVAKYEAKLGTMDYGDLPEYINVGVGQQKMRQDHPTYAAMIESVDTNIGRLMDQVEALGISSNTVFIFTSDNGGLSNRGGYNNRELATSNLPLRTGKGWLYEGGIREAFIVSGGGVSAMVNSNAVVTGTDVYPTCLELAGLPLRPADHYDGVSFAAALRGEAYSRGEPIFWHSPQARPYSTGDFNSSAVREGDYKLIWFYDSAGQPVELYNVRTDPGEQIDLSDLLPMKAADLLDKIKAWHAGAHDGSGVVFRPDENDVSKPPQAWLDDPTVPLALQSESVNLRLDWASYAGYDYRLFSRTNLLEGSWVEHEPGLTTNTATVSMPENTGYFKVESVLHTEIK